MTDHPIDHPHATPRRRVAPGAWWWPPVGALLVLATGALAVAIWTGESLNCAPGWADGDFCGDAEPAVWFESAEADAIAGGAALLAYVALPVLIGDRSRRWSWVLLFCPLAVLFSATGGAHLGAWVLRRYYPDLYWYNDWDIDLDILAPGLARVLGFAIAPTVAMVGITLGEKKAILSCPDLSGRDLSGAYLSGAVLSDRDLTGANLTGAALCSADLSHANLTGANLTRANLRDATGLLTITGEPYWDGTVCPDGTITGRLGRRSAAGACPPPT